MRKIAVEKSGSPAWPRYLLRDDQGGYWTGTCWSGDRRSALLFYRWNDISHQYRLLEEEQWNLVPSRDFDAVISVRAWSSTAFTLEQLQDYMHRAVAIMLDHAGQGTGPVPESLVGVDINWATLHETRPGING